MSEHVSNNSGRLIGYARVSTADQVLQRQLDELEAAGWTIMDTDTASGSSDDRAGLAQALMVFADGDILVVTRLDRLGRSTSGLVNLSTALRQRGPKKPTTGLRCQHS